MSLIVARILSLDVQKPPLTVLWFLGDTSSWYLIYVDSSRNMARGNLPLNLPHPKHLLDMRLGEPQSWSGCSRQREKSPSLPLPGIEPWFFIPYLIHYTD
jgi:hypothetical protein